MIKKPVTLAFSLALLLTLSLPGCGRHNNLSEQEHIQRAKDFEDKGDLKGGIIELKNAIQKNPSNAQARLLLGQIYLKAELGAEAEKELTQAEKLGVSRESIQPALGEALLLMGEYKRVLDEIQPGGQTSNINLARIYQIRGEAHFKQGKLKEACNLFQQSLDANAELPPTYWGLAQCAIADRDMAKAKNWLDVALKIKDRQAKTWVLIGDWERLSKNSPGALTAYTNALKLDSNNLEALQNRATLSMALSQSEKASQDIEHIGKIAPKSLKAHYLRALFSFHQKKFPEARDALHEVFKITSDHMPSVLLAGTTAYALGSYQQAESYFNRFLARFPSHVFARKMMAATQIKLNVPDKALETLAPLILVTSSDAQALALASDAYRSKNEHAKAAVLLERAALIDPKNASIQTQLGITHLTTGDSLLAITNLETAASLEGNQYRAESLLALTYLNRREYDKALAAIDAMEKKLHRSAITHNMRGNAYLGKNDLVNARRSFEQALKIDQGFLPSATSLAQLDLRDKKPEMARKRFDLILEKDKNNLQAMMALAGLASIQKQEPLYVEWLIKAAKIHPEAMPPRTALARYYLAKKDYKKALSITTEAVQANPDKAEALILLGNTQLAADDKTGAIATFTKLTQKIDSSPEAFLRLALAQITNKNLKQARVNLQKALQIKADHVPTQENLIRLEMTENKPEAALQVAREIQAQQPKSPLGYDREGDLQLAENHLPEAVKAYQKALEKGAGSAGFIKLFRAQAISNGKVAEQRLIDWLKQHPKDTAVRAYAAEYFMGNGQNKEAITQYQEINRQTPNKVILLNNLANLYLSEKDGRALATAEQAIKLAPDHPMVQDTYGWALVQLGQAPRGLEWLNKAVTTLPKNASVRYHHAAALAYTGNKTLARKELEKLLTDTPKFAEIEAAKALLKSL